MYIYDKISWNSSCNEKCSDKSYRENQDTSFILNIFFFFFFFQKLCHLQDKVEKCGSARQATDDYIIWRMHTASG